MASRAPNKLLDSVIDGVIIRTDRDLSRHLKVTASSISDLRNGAALGDSMRLRFMRKFGISLKKIDDMSPPKNEAKI